MRSAIDRRHRNVQFRGIRIESDRQKRGRHMHGKNQPQTGNTGGSDNRRTKYIINPAFQWKYAIVLASMVFLISAALSSVLYGFLHAQARQRLMQPETYTAEVTLVILGFALGLAALTAGGVGLWSIVMTHRICGPLMVIERYLREIGGGRLPKLRDLRRKDEFKDFYRTFSGMVQSLKAGKQEEIETLRRIQAIAESAQEADDETRRRALESVANQVAELSQAAHQALEGQPADDGAAKPATLRSEQREPVAAV